jgi:hypothetical protein
MPQIESTYGKMPMLAIWAFCGAAINFAIGYNMYGERGVQNRVCHAAADGCAMKSCYVCLAQSWQMAKHAPNQ